MFLSNTDFPVPEGPRMAVIRPLGTSKVMSSNTVCEPKDLVTPRREMMGSPGAIHGWAPEAGVSVSGEGKAPSAAVSSDSSPVQARARDEPSTWASGDPECRLVG